MSLPDPLLTTTPKPSWFLSLTVTLVCIYGTFGCSCFPGDPQDLYCKSTVAIIAKVTNMAYGEGIPGITAKQFYDVEVSHVYKGVGNLSGGALLLRYCDLVSKLPLNFPDWVFPLETYYDCRCKVPRYYSGEGKPKNSCVYSERFRCLPGSGALGDLAECRYSDQVDDCEWQC
uniref:Uncharacterized protein n=1 Tax=Magallana gigas TaxID=29159 RepID=K1RKS3_MAGGI